MKSRRGFLVHLLLTIAALGPGTALGGSPPNTDEGLTLQCEFMLVKPLETVTSAVWIKARLQSVAGPAPAQVSPQATELALRALGLPYPPIGMRYALTLHADVTRSNQLLYWFRIHDEDGTEVRAFPLHIPPLFVWKRAIAGDGESSLDWTLKSERMEELAFGTVSAAPGVNQIFLSLGQTRSNFLTVTIGLDVDCADFRRYSRSESPQFVLPYYGTPEEHYCRVVVLTGKLPVTSPIMRRHGGPIGPR